MTTKFVIEARDEEGKISGIYEFAFTSWRGGRHGAHVAAVNMEIDLNNEDQRTILWEE